MGLGGDPDGATSGTRASATLLTDPDAAQVWRDVSRQVARYLRARGVTGPDVDDIVQEVAVRAMAHEVEYLDADDLTAWCLVVARNLHTDAARRARSTSDLDDLQSTPGSVNVETLIEHRVAVTRLLHALSSLPADDLAVLFADRSAPGSLSKLESTRLAVRRHRIRARLAKLVAGLLGLAGALGLRGPRIKAVLLAPALASAGFLIAVIAIGVLPYAVAQPPAQGSIPRSAPIGRPTSRLADQRQAPVAQGARRTHPHPSTRPRPVDDQASRQRLVAVNPGGHHPVYIDRQPAAPSDHLLCLDHVPVLGGGCVG